MNIDYEDGQCEENYEDYGDDFDIEPSNEDIIDNTTASVPDYDLLTTEINSNDDLNLDESEDMVEQEIMVTAQLLVISL